MVVDNIVDLEFDIDYNFVEVVAVVEFYKHYYRIMEHMNHVALYCSSLVYTTFFLFKIYICVLIFIIFIEVIYF